MIKQDTSNTTGMARRIMPALCAGLLSVFCVGVSIAQTAPAYPSKPLVMIIPNSPGGPGDVLLRLLGPKLTEAWGQPVVADFRPGATGLIGSETLARSAPDGHTMFQSSLTSLLGTLLHQKYLLGDFAAVTMIGATPFALVVNESVPVRSIAELISYARAHKDELAYGSTGNWGSAHLCMEAFNQMVGVSMLHVPYKDASLATNGLMSGQVQGYCAAAANANTMARSGKVRILGVTYQKPTRLMPGAAPVAETVGGFEFLGWYGMQVNKGTPPQIVDRLNAELVKAIRSPDASERMLATGIDPVASTSTEFTAFVRNESARFAKILKERNARLD